MAASLSVTQLNTTTLVAQDTSTGISVTSRSLSVYDSNLTLLQTINMGVSTSVNVTIPKDGYYRFILTLNGTITVTSNFLATMIYDIQALTLEQELDCGCAASKSLCNDAVRALMAKQWAITYLTFNQPQNSQRCIDTANTLIQNTTTPCGC